MIMSHPGLPLAWAILIVICMLLLSLRALLASPQQPIQHKTWSLQRLPVVGSMFRLLVRNHWPLLLLKLVFVTLFILIIIAGLWGTPLAERNLATSLTWNLWWTAVIITVLFGGSTWCGVCPWDTIANWLVNHRLWRRSNSNSRLLLPLPKPLRSLWPATLLFIAFSWLELGVGIVASPYSTAILALAMVVMATLVLALFQGKAFCRYICPVGRTLGAYSQLAPIALRAIDPDTCKSCKTLDCFHGSQDIAPCPTGLVMGRLQESTYCISCGNCTMSCPSKNVGWRLRSPSVEAIQDAKPHTDEAWFMLTLLAITSFHGMTMLPRWQITITNVAQLLNDSGQLLASFSIGLAAFILLPIAIYALAINLSRILINNNDRPHQYRKLFSGFAFVSLPLAFSYHLAHNLNHLLRESSNWWQLLSNPLGIDTLPLSMLEKHQRHMSMLIPEQLMFALQTLLLIGGFLLAVQVIRHRGYRLFGAQGYQLLPMLLFAISITGLNLWLIIQPMTMRM
jgi:polyferredoxin